MVLSKVDPFDGAFPVQQTPGIPVVQPSEVQLSQSFTQPQILQTKAISQLPLTGKRNPFKAPTNDKSPASILPKKPLVSKKSASSKAPPVQPDDSKYGKDFKIPELPPLL